MNAKVRVFANAIEYNFGRATEANQMPFEVCQAANHLAAYFQNLMLESPLVPEPGGARRDPSSSSASSSSSAAAAAAAASSSSSSAALVVKCLTKLTHNDGGEACGPWLKMEVSVDAFVDILWF
jgi:hypothetical protein